jgi:hypothetical protein
MRLAIKLKHQQSIYLISMVEVLTVSLKLGLPWQALTSTATYFFCTCLGSLAIATIKRNNPIC